MKYYGKSTYQMMVSYYTIYHLSTFKKNHIINTLKIPNNFDIFFLFLDSEIGVQKKKIIYLKYNIPKISSLNRHVVLIVMYKMYVHRNNILYGL